MERCHIILLKGLGDLCVVNVVVNAWCEDVKSWINNVAHWDTVPDNVENYHKPFSNDQQRNVEIQERVRHVKEQITKELEKPHFICVICKHHFLSKGTKITHETTHLCKKVKKNMTRVCFIR